MQTLSIRDARRLALARAGLLKPEWTDMPRSARGKGASARSAAQAIIERFGYLQLDTVPIAGARSHALVLLSRLRGMAPELGESLLDKGAPLFEYWGHEACWLPLDLYPVFEFRRQAFRTHPWWGDVVAEHADVADRLLAQIREQGALRSVDMEGPGGRGWWDFKVAKKVATALWSLGALAIRERKNFIRAYDLADRVIPAKLRNKPVPLDKALRVLMLRALHGHGWATKGTLAATWRLKNLSREIQQALKELEDRGDIVACALENPSGRATPGWIRPDDLELGARLRRVRPSGTDAVLLSPFDPVLWDRARVQRLFGFEQVLEIYKPAATRVYGYYCLPVLAGESLIGRVDLKADRKRGRLALLSKHFEDRKPGAEARQAMQVALTRHADSVGLALKGS